MPYRLYFWLALQSGSIGASLLALVFFALDRTAEPLIFIPVAWLTWVFRPKDWRDSLNSL
jgi:hypothetical protein